MTVEELFTLTGENMETFLQDLKKMNLGYGNFAGTPRLRNAVAGLYRGVSPEAGYKLDLEEGLRLIDEYMDELVAEGVGLHTEQKPFTNTDY